MQFLSLRLKNYKRIKAGLDLDEIFIDFTKRRHKLCIIVGDNGSGKSTILNALSLYPDSYDDYMDKLPAEKEMFVAVDNLVYHIRIIASVTNKSVRSQQKAYIEKDRFELNPNGNISSYKEIIESEFDMDPNTMALAFLSSTDRGLADKKPTERKRYVAAINSSLDVYNGLNKNLSKKANVFKSHINTIHNKITTLGNEEEIRTRLSTLESRLNSLEQNKDSLNAHISRSQTIISTLDPTSEIQNTYQNIYENLKSINDTIKILESPINIELKKLDISEDEIYSECDTINKCIEAVNNKINKYEYDVRQQEIQLKEDCEELNIKNAKLSNINSDLEYETLISSINELKTKISTQENIFKNINMDFNTSKSEFISIFNILTRIKDQIDIIISQYTESILSDSCDSLLNDINLSEIIINKNEMIRELKETISNEEKLLMEKENIKTSMKNNPINIPKECFIDNCPYVEYSVKLLEDYKNVDAEIEELDNRLSSHRESLSSYKEYLDTVVDVDCCSREINNIIVYIENNRFLISKTKISNIFLDRIIFINKIKHGNKFNEIQDCSKLITQADLIESYQDNKNKLIELEADKKVLDTKYEMILEISDDINKLEEKVNTMKENTSNLMCMINQNKQLLDKYISKIDRINLLISNIESLNEARRNKTELSNQYKKIKDDISKISKEIDSVNYDMSQVQITVEEIQSISDEKDKYKYALVMIDQYNQELNMYQEKFELVDTLRRYSSPNTGIQTLFISMYMNKTRKLANELLSSFFNGEMYLENYVINENEFRIPCRKSGWLIDDLSSCSTAQVCMISMILSLVMLIQSSPIYNIVKFDEIDSGLDYNNRLNFLDLLYKLIDILGIEQAFLISHSSESSLMDVDIISLKYNSDNQLFGNIIYSYNDEEKNYGSIRK